MDDEKIEAEEARVETLLNKLNAARTSIEYAIKSAATSEYKLDVSLLEELTWVYRRINCIIEKC